MNTKACSSDRCESTKRMVAPAADIVFDTARGVYQIVMDMPGVSEDMLEVKTQEGELEISASTASKVSGTELRCEAPPRSYHRTFRLAEDVDVDRISASLDSGVLSIEIPRQAHRQPRKIKVQVTQ